MNLKETYNKIAKDWSEVHKQDTWWIEGTGKFVSFFKEGDFVLDVGCGSGVKSQYLIDRGLKVSGIDFSEKMIELAREEVSKGEFEVVDMEDVDKLEENFDGIFAQASLLHIPKSEINNVLTKLKSKLKVGGYLYIAVKGIKDGGKEEEIKTEDDVGYEYKRFFSYFSLDEIKEYLKELGFGIVYENITPSGGTKWIQVIGRKS